MIFIDVGAFFMCTGALFFVFIISISVFTVFFGGGKVRGINKTQKDQNYNLSILWGQEAGGRRDASRNKGTVIKLMLI